MHLKLIWISQNHKQIYLDVSTVALTKVLLLLSWSDTRCMHARQRSGTPQYSDNQQQYYLTSNITYLKAMICFLCQLMQVVETSKLSERVTRLDAEWNTENELSRGPCRCWRQRTTSELSSRWRQTPSAHSSAPSGSPQSSGSRPSSTYPPHSRHLPAHSTRHSMQSNRFTCHRQHHWQ